jgi:hypothetical protein
MATLSSLNCASRWLQSGGWSAAGAARACAREARADIAMVACCFSMSKPETVKKLLAYVLDKPSADMDPKLAIKCAHWHSGMRPLSLARVPGIPTWRASSLRVK